MSKNRHVRDIKKLERSFLYLIKRLEDAECFMMGEVKGAHVILEEGDHPLKDFLLLGWQCRLAGRVGHPRVLTGRMHAILDQLHSTSNEVGCDANFFEPLVFEILGIL